MIQLQLATSLGQAIRVHFRPPSTAPVVWETRVRITQQTLLKLPPVTLGTRLSPCHRMNHLAERRWLIGAIPADRHAVSRLIFPLFCTNVPNAALNGWHAVSCSRPNGWRAPKQAFRVVLPAPPTQQNTEVSNSQTRPSFRFCATVER